MAEDLRLTPGLAREERYKEILPQIAAVISDETDTIANLANIAAILKEAFGFFWVGFYRLKEGELVLGPFQGPLACTRISLDRGVCGAAASAKQTIIVPDVEKFPGHIACSSASRSEIVVPLVAEEQTILVLDVDSDQYNDFSETDQYYLGQLMEMVRSVYQLPENQRVS
ncbi:MAG: GAF domain-containing protein [Bacteroidia bacterium]